MKSKIPVHKALILILLLTFLLTACNKSDSVLTNGINGDQVFSVNKIFRSFYKQLGGVETLGVIISEVFSWDDHQCQYSEKALMCFNENYSKNNGFFLFPTAAVFTIPDEVRLNQSDESGTTEIFSGFKDLYGQVGGEDMVGKPLTSIRYNLQEKRIEQYFENLGFFQQYDDPSETNLLSYGVYACQDKCKFSAKKGTAVNLNADSVELPFLTFITRYKNLNTFGEPLTAPLEIQPGLIQQVYQNVVFIGNPTLPETIHLVDLPVRLNFPQDEPGPQIFTAEDNMVFYIVNSPYGFHVPTIFDQFIMQHGGRELSGTPMGEVYQEDNIIRQCFQNYCLDYIPDEKSVKMVGLGQQYLQTMDVEVAQVVQLEFSPQSVILNHQEKSPNVSLNEEQMIEIQVLRSDDQSPLQNIDAELQITLPNGNQHLYTIPATDEFGTSMVTIPVIKRVQNGSVIGYSICLAVPSSEPICVKDSFLIW